MRNVLEDYLLKFKRKTISFEELEQVFPKTFPYQSFAELILQFEDEKVLEMVKSRGRNQRNPSVAYHYRIHKHLLNRSYHRQLEFYIRSFHDAIDLDAYFKLDPSVWLEDLPYLEKINSYIQQNGFPTEKEPAPARSFELVGNEKWIENKGSAVLHRVNLWEKMNILPVSDPLMFAINPNKINEANQLHFIVENKTTYQGLLLALPQSQFSTLIYGSGEKISKSIENFSYQYPVTEANHYFIYFGDIDRSGISIWNHLHKRQKSIPALPFYIACFTKDEAFGKTNQRLDQAAIEAFLTFFPLNISGKIRALLEKGAYYPQEVLKTEELQQIWLQEDWYKLIEPYINNSRIGGLALSSERTNSLQSKGVSFVQNKATRKVHDSNGTN